MHKVLKELTINLRLINFIFLFTLFFPVLISCEKKPNLNSIILQGKMNAESILTSTKEYNEKEFEFQDYSSQGGVLRVYTDDDNSKWFSALLFGEMGKELYECYPFGTNIYIIRTTFFYDKSIYDGDVVIVNEEKEIMAIINGTQYLVTDTISKSPDQSIKSMIDEMLRLTNG